MSSSHSFIQRNCLSVVNAWWSTITCNWRQKWHLERIINYTNQCPRMCWHSVTIPPANTMPQRHYISRINIHRSDSLMILCIRLMIGRWCCSPKHSPMRINNQYQGATLTLVRLSRTTTADLRTSRVRKWLVRTDKLFFSLTCPRTSRFSPLPAHYRQFFPAKMRCFGRSAPFWFSNLVPSREFVYVSAAITWHVRDFRREHNKHRRANTEEHSQFSAYFFEKTS